MPEHVTVFRVCSYACPIPVYGQPHIDTIDRELLRTDVYNVCSLISGHVGDEEVGPLLQKIWCSDLTDQLRLMKW